MSRNFELLRRTESLMRTTLFAAVGDSTLGSHERDTVRPCAGEVPPLADGQSALVKMPAAELQPLETREILKLIRALFRPADPDAARMVVVAGVDQRVSSAWITACAGQLLAEQGQESICVVDANWHNTELHRFFEVANGTGLSDAVVGNGSIRDYCRRISSKLWLLSAGSLARENDLVERDALGVRIEQLRREFGYCLIVGPPIGTSADALVMGHMSDGVLLVLEAHKTRRDSAIAAKEMLAAAKVPLLGAVLSNRTFPIPQTLYRRL
jgi:Mrp family chromosome partitioning ATPase